MWTLLWRSIRHQMRWLWRCFQSRYDNYPFCFLSQSIEKFQFKKKEFYKGGKRNGDQKSKQITITSGIVSQPSQQTTAAIAELNELIGRTYQGFWQFLESAGLTSKQAQRPKPVPEVLVWLVPRLNLFSFLFFIAEKVRLKDFLFLVPFFGKWFLKVTENIPENVG